MTKLTALVSSFARQVKQYGIKGALDVTLDYLGIGEFHLKYPITGRRFAVKGDPIFWKSLQAGRWELTSIKYVLTMLKEGQIILDVGAWIGSYTLLFAKSAGVAGKVYAFEPDPKARGILQKNVDKNGLANVSVEKFALSNTNGEATLKAHGLWASSMSYMTDRPDEKTEEQIAVKTTTIDSFCAERGIRPSGFKIDVEGAEALVIEGALETIKKYAPWVLLEFHGQFMSPEQRKNNWEIITGTAKKVVFIDGESQYLTYGSEVKSMPDCPYCYVFINY